MTERMQTAQLLVYRFGPNAGFELATPVGLLIAGDVAEGVQSGDVLGS